MPLNRSFAKDHQCPLCRRRYTRRAIQTHIERGTCTADFNQTQKDILKRLVFHSSETVEATAKAVGCSPSYVRSVRSRGFSDSDSVEEMYDVEKLLDNARDRYLADELGDVEYEREVERILSRHGTPPDEMDSTFDRDFELLLDES